MKYFYLISSFFIIISCSQKTRDYIDDETKIQQEKIYYCKNEIEKKYYINPEKITPFRIATINVSESVDSFLLLKDERKYELLSDKLIEFRNTIISAELFNSSYIKHIIIEKRLNRWISDDSKYSGSFESKNFILDLKKLESELIEFLLNSIEKDHYKFNALVPVIVDSSANIKVGETYISNIMLAAYDTTRSHIVMVADISQPDSVLYLDKADNEKLFNLESFGQYCIYRKKVHRKGLHGYKGVIKTIDAEGYEEKYFFEKTFNVTD
ncbi:MAG: hypothetical protein AB7S69_08630 [Salinivirgaceae bacterium]